MVLVGCAAAYLPFTLLGYGTDIDVPNVLRAGRRWLDDGVYELSRKPGTVVHEVATAALDRVGGSVLVKAKLRPNEEVTVPIVITWHFPNVNDVAGRAKEQPAATACNCGPMCSGRPSRANIRSSCR